VKTAVEIVAGGGVVWRRRGGKLRFLLVHRPRYDDWSFPKGKLDPGERVSQCALREVEEETGYRCKLGKKIATITYPTDRGRTKEVRYWLMRVLDGDFEPNDEVDEIRWASAEKAKQLLTYARDLPVLRAARKGLE